MCYHTNVESKRSKPMGKKPAKTKKATKHDDKKRMMMIDIIILRLNKNTGRFAPVVPPKRSHHKKVAHK